MEIFFLFPVDKDLFIVNSEDNRTNYFEVVLDSFLLT